MTKPAKNYSKRVTPEEQRVLAGTAEPPPAASAVSDHSDVLERCAKLRELLFECEKLCSWLSSAVNTPQLPAGAWIYVDAARLNVLTSMRTAQLLQLRVQQLAELTPPAAEG